MSEQNSLRDSINELRAIPALWKHLADPAGELRELRVNPDYDPWLKPEWEEGYEVGSHEAKRCACYAPRVDGQA